MNVPQWACSQTCNRARLLADPDGDDNPHIAVATDKLAAERFLLDNL